MCTVAEVLVFDAFYLREDLESPTWKQIPAVLNIIVITCSISYLYSHKKVFITIISNLDFLEALIEVLSLYLFISFQTAIQLSKFSVIIISLPSHITHTAEELGPKINLLLSRRT